MVTKELLKYIEENIFPLYESDAVDKGHRKPHIDDVINRSLKFAEAYNNVHEDKLNYDMVYTIAAYHDVGLSKAPRKIHEQKSAEMLLEDKELLRFFNPEQIAIMAVAVRDHRASNDHDPESIYGKIVSQADRSFDLNHIIHRAYQYRQNDIECMNNRDLMISEIIKHIIEKYGDNGYARSKMWFEDERLSSFFKEVSDLSKDYNKLYKLINNTIGEKNHEKDSH